MINVLIWEIGHEGHSLSFASDKARVLNLKLMNRRIILNENQVKSLEKIFNSENPSLIIPVLQQLLLPILNFTRGTFMPGLKEFLAPKDAISDLIESQLPLITRISQSINEWKKEKSILTFEELGKFCGIKTGVLKDLPQETKMKLNTKLQTNIAQNNILEIANTIDRLLAPHQINQGTLNNK